MPIYNRFALSIHKLEECDGVSIKSRKVSFLDKTDKTVTLSGICIISKQEYKIRNVFWEDLKAWLSGGLIQDTLPNLTAEDRDFLTTGISPRYQ